MRPRLRRLQEAYCGLTWDPPLSWAADGAPVCSLAARHGPAMIIDQTDRIDNGNRCRQSWSYRPESAGSSRCAAEGAQRPAGRAPDWHWPVLDEPQPRAAAGIVR